MNKQQKVKEAKYFYSKMKENKLKREEFEFNLSAFLNSSRSVLQYIIVETNSQKWYDNKMSNNQLFKFFKDIRDINIHEKPILPKANHKIQATASIQTSISLIVSDKEGNITSKREIGDSEKNLPNEVKTDIEYFFDNWKEDEHVLLLCEKYINEIETFLEEGVKLKYLKNTK